MDALVAAGHTVYEGYTPGDSRHRFAARLVRGGASLHVVADQLGHKDAQMVARGCGRFVPRHEERARWEPTPRPR